MLLLLLLIDAAARSLFNCICVLIDKSSVTLAPLDADAAAAAQLLDFVSDLPTLVTGTASPWKDNGTCVLFQ